MNKKTENGLLRIYGIVNLKFNLKGKGLYCNEQFNKKEDLAWGCYLPHKRYIILNPKLKEKQLIEALLHELAHSYCHIVLGLNGKRKPHGKSFLKASKRINSFCDTFIFAHK
jgi:predicted SprT family Zn-dependent metalloprotease